ncbi:MAG TPA: hypothetical protein VIL68_01855 [Propionibacteriaceae bacterium]
MPLDDLTGTWIDAQYHLRRAWLCECDDRNDVWHVTPPGPGDMRHYDGDTIRIWWTLDPTSVAAR